MDDEIDLVKVILDLWKGKWKIVKSAVIAFIISLGLIFFLPQPNYQANTELKPITSIDSIKYNQLNSFDFFKITSQDLLNLYIEQVEFKSIFKDTIKDLEIYKKSDFETEEDYENAIIKLASRIEILLPNDNKKNGDIRKYHQIIFNHTDEELWQNILTEFDKISQEFIRNELIERFNQKVLIEKTKIKYQLDDIETQISAQTLNYNLQIQNRLAYLEEQAQLARTLGIKSNTLETQNFDSKNFSITNIDTKAPFYLRGYESIEKEIALINSRKDEKKYIDALIELENKKYLLNEDKNLERIEELFLNTPITQKESFVAANLNIEETEFEYKNNQKFTILILAIFLGLFVGSIYVLLSNSLRNRKQTPVS